MAMHATESQDLLARVREEVTSTCSHQSLEEMDLKTLSNNPLLASIYAETLRLYVKTFTIVSSPLEDVSLGNAHFPKGNLGLVNSHMAHMDSEFWNTKNESHPLQSFWAERFLTDPTDLSSGPSRLMRHESDSKKPHADVAPYFSLKGLEGSWIPYGGKISINLTHDDDESVLSIRVSLNSHSIQVATWFALEGSWLRVLWSSLLPS